jgi:ABC-type lipoprotein release transport system permease subunit
VAARRRDGELAVLRALGMTRPQARLVSVTQACVYAVAGLVIGIPLGVALGRTLWRAVARSTPLAYVPPLPVGVLLLATPLTLAAVQVLAAPAGRRTAGMRVADVLRSE